MGAGVVLLIVALVLRATARNRHIQARLTVSAVALAAYTISHTALLSSYVPPGVQPQLLAIHPLLIAFAVLNALVALVFNPWTTTRLPDRFPTIVQDALVLGLFALTATLILQEKVLAATAAGAVVLGLALQNTLGNLFAGLAIQIEKPFRVGHWVRIADIDGLVNAVTWRATKVRTKNGNFVIVPNSRLADDVIINYSEPTPETRIEVEIGASYETPPNVVKATILAALKSDPTIPTAREPEVLLKNFGASAVNYRVMVWTTEFGSDDHICDRIQSAVYYSFRRRNIEIPYPIQVEISRQEKVASTGIGPAAAAALRDVAILAALREDDHAELARSSRTNLYSAGEIVVQQDEPGTSMFVIVSGACIVTLGSDGREVARLGPGGFFGEMSLLTGAPRNATVRTTTDSELVEIDAEPFRRFVLANPSAVVDIGAAVAVRRAELEERRAAGGVAVAAEPSINLIDRIRRFFGLVE